MCVVSMVYDWTWDKWNRRYNPPPIVVPNPAAPYYPWPAVPVPQPTPPAPTPEEVQEFRDLLDRAREYDKRTSQPDCETEEKRRKLLDLADQLGIKIDFA